MRPSDQSELIRLSQMGWQPAADFSPDTALTVVRPQAVDYPSEGLKALGADGGSGYWFDHRARAVVEALQAVSDRRTIWEVGAGTGAMSLRLAKAGFEVVALEPLLEGAEAIARIGGVTVFCGTLSDLELPDSSLQMVGLFDVIEHLSEPRALLTEVRRVLEPGGVVVLTVPAFPSLWSREDEIAGHHRRYTRRSLGREMQSTGFRMLRDEYLFASLLPLSFVLRALPYRLGRRRTAAQVHSATSKQLAPNPGVDRVARAVLRGEHRLARYLRLPAGLSVLGIYAKVEP